MTTEVRETVTYYINAIGYIWMPCVLGATTRKYERNWTFGTWSPQPNWDDPKEELEAIEVKLGTDTGDFQSIKDWSCDKVVKRIYQEGDEWVERTRTVTIKEWDDEESALAFSDCMCPAED